VSAVVGLCCWASGYAGPARARGEDRRALVRRPTMRRALSISGIYPHLAVFNAAGGRGGGFQGECGIGAVVPWAEKLWLITYPPHRTKGSPDKLYAIDEEMKLEIRPESVGGTHASRMIHRESNQLIIGPYFIDARGNVRAANVNKLVGRMTGVARHLTDPANRVYFYDMEGAVYEVDVRTLAVKKLFAKPVPGDHGKGAYTGQGRLVVSNNGERRARNGEELGVLAEWDGREWRVIERKQFTDVTGPGGIHGSPDDESPVWSIGWDRRSVILKLLDHGRWHTFRMPKASHCFDPAHGWYTEWPRIREAAPGRLLMDMHGMFYDFPRGFDAEHTGGIAPVASHLRYVPDFCHWNGRLVLASDDASIMQNPMAGQPQSNLWFGKLDDIRGFGPPSGWGGVWLGESVRANVPSEPFLVGGFARRCLHLSTGSGGAGPSAMRCTDRYRISEMPAELESLARVTVARGDYHKPAPGYSFDVNRDVVVYIAVDDRGRPPIPEGWRKTGMTMRWERFTDSVYVRPFPKGRVTIPAHETEHKRDAYGIPCMCFVRDASGGEGSLEITNLPAGRRATVTRPEAASLEHDVTFALEGDVRGDGAWKHYARIEVPAGVYRYHLFPDDFEANWVRIAADTDCTATAYFHLGSPRYDAGDDDGIFSGVARADETRGVSAGLVRPAAHNRNLQYLARIVGDDGQITERYYEVDEKLVFIRPAEGRAAEVKRIAAVRKDFEVDAASVIMMHKGRRYRLPKGDGRFDQPFATGWPRGIRECVSERYLVNVHGTFYELPRDDGLPLIKPVCTHNRRIMDFCTWRGLMVISGVRASALPDGQVFVSGDGAALWFGSIDDLWALGRPRGTGGPWRNTAVRADSPSDPYLMTGYDRKTLELSHDAAAEVTFTIQVDFDHRQWKTYRAFTVPAGETLTHRFPDGYSAHWVRLVAGADCAATATFVYE